MSERETFFELFDFLKKEAYVFCNRRKGRNGKLRYCPYASTERRTAPCRAD